MWAKRSFPTILSISFKRVIGTVDDGAVPNHKKNPSSPLIVQLPVNNQLVYVMVDTGSATSIIRIDTLKKLEHQPRINYLENVYRTANNGEFYTIGTVKLKINIGKLITYIVAQIALDLCTELILGNDWIQLNDIDIISSQRKIRKRQGNYTATIPFSINHQTESILPIVHVDDLRDEPLKELNCQKLKNDIASLPIVSLSNSSSSSANQRVERNFSNELRCRTCQIEFSSKKELFVHLREDGHYSSGDRMDLTGPNLAIVSEQIKKLTEHISNARDKKQVELILLKNGMLFDTSNATTINTTVHHTIEVKNSRPIVQRPYRKTEEQEQIIEKMCDEFFKAGIIRPSQSSWASPVVLQRKKDNSWRFCIDYRKLNEVTEKDNFPLPRIQEIFDQLNGSKYFSKLDFNGGYHQVPIHESDKPKTAFITRNQFWEFNVMPQGIKNGPPTFQRIVNQVLGRLQHYCALAYIDDIVIYSRTKSEHIDHIEQVLSVLLNSNFRLNAKKCEFFRKKIQFLGHVICENGILPSPEKVQAIQDIPTPVNVKSAISFVKMAEYYRNHIPNFSSMAQPLFDLMKKNVKFSWTIDHQRAFEMIKQSLTSKPLLLFANLEIPFIIQVDASNIGIGAALMQNHGKGEQPVAFMSQKFNKQQKNWNATEKECYAIVSSIRKWDYYVAGHEFIVRTDHHALCWLNRKFNSNPKLNRWRMALQEYSFKIEHVKGKNNCVPDCLSRYPVDPPCDEFDDQIEQRSISTQTDDQQLIVGLVTTRRAQRTLEQQRSTRTDSSEEQQRSTRTDSSEKQQSMESQLPRQQQPVAPDKPVQRSINRIQVFTKEQLKQYQQDDMAIRKIIENIEKKPIKDEYSLIDGMLYRNVNRFRGILKVPVVPRVKVNDVLLAYHNSSINGAHFGKDRTYYKIRDRYYWSGMYNDVVKHVKSCPNCSINKVSRKKPNGHLNPINPPAGVWENLAVDFFGPVTPASSKGNRFILVVTDLLSKFVVAKPTRDNTALSAAKVLMEDVIFKYGTPNQILSDNGTHFTSSLFNSIMSIYGICHVFTTPYNPRANGVCERFNSSMCDSLASICNGNKSNWDEQVSKVIFAYNASRHSTTGFTPYELMFGRLCKLPFDLPSTTTVAEPHSYIKQLKQYIKEANQAVRANIMFNQRKSQERHDNNRSNDLYVAGDFVYVKRLDPCRKLERKYNGPYQVIQQLNQSIYRIQDPNDLRVIMNIHINRLRRYYPRQ